MAPYDLTERTEIRLRQWLQFYHKDELYNLSLEDAINELLDACQGKVQK